MMAFLLFFFSFFVLTSISRRNSCPGCDGSFKPGLASHFFLIFWNGGVASLPHVVFQHFSRMGASWARGQQYLTSMCPFLLSPFFSLVVFPALSFSSIGALEVCSALLSLYAPPAFSLFSCFFSLNGSGDSLCRFFTPTLF